MRISKRSFARFMLLNCLTLGIYGFITFRQIGKEINALCAGDGEEPRFGYTGAVLFRAIAPIIGLFGGLISGLSGITRIGGLLGIAGGATPFCLVVTSMISGGITGTLVGTSLSGIYLNYWWYRQTGRLKANAYRFGLKLKEGGTDTFLFRTALNLVLAPFTLILYVLSCLLPLLLIAILVRSSLGTWGVESQGGLTVAVILAFVCAVPMMLFGMELSCGASYSIFFLFKNMNRFSDVVEGGAYSFTPMGYEYYPSTESLYPGFLPALNGGQIGSTAPDSVMDKLQELEKKLDEHGESGGSGGGSVTVDMSGAIEGVKGPFAGYRFSMSPGEEIVIGKDSSVCSVVLDPSFVHVSRKHVGVAYDLKTDKYRVTDYSANGTWANGEKLARDVPAMVNHGTILKLAKDGVIFRLA